ncbi:hypothetical protein ABW19_dt0203524 [Dactylella cylindrospora]|nr:hypothetical protein ABW19_dt0203524 [Dactylella cylindrospora]
MASPTQRKASIALVDYSDSDDDEVSSPEDSRSIQLSSSSPTTSTSLPPLPSKFHDLYTTNPRLTTEDDPSAHGGRHRAIPHVEGNWPTHIYFEWHLNSTEISTIGNFIEAARHAVGRYEQFHKYEEGLKLESFLYSDLGTRLPLHISLSRPIVLRTEQREEFMESLENGLKKISLEPFDVKFSDIEWVPNQDRTRWFWVMRATSPIPVGRRQQALSALLNMCNFAARQFKQPGLYLTDWQGNARDGFHVSIGWSLKEPPEQLRSEMATAITEFQPQLSELTMRCDALKVKIGNTVHALELKLTPQKSSVITN